MFSSYFSCDEEKRLRERFPLLRTFYYPAAGCYRAVLLQADGEGYLDVTPPGLFMRPVALWGALTYAWNNTEEAKASCHMELPESHEAALAADAAADAAAAQTATQQPQATSLTQDELAAVKAAVCAAHPGAWEYYRADGWVIVCGDQLDQVIQLSGNHVNAADAWVQAASRLAAVPEPAAPPVAATPESPLSRLPLELKFSELFQEQLGHLLTVTDGLPLLVDIPTLPTLPIASCNQNWRFVECCSLFGTYSRLAHKITRLTGKFPMLCALVTSGQPVPEFDEQNPEPAARQILTRYRTVYQQLLALRFGEAQQLHKLKDKPKLPAMTASTGWVLRLLHLELQDEDWREMLEIRFPQQDD